MVICMHDLIHAVWLRASQRLVNTCDEPTWRLINVEDSERNGMGHAAAKIIDTEVERADCDAPRTISCSGVRSCHLDVDASNIKKL